MKLSDTCKKGGGTIQSQWIQSTILIKTTCWAWHACNPNYSRDWGRKIPNYKSASATELGPFSKLKINRAGDVT